jgi:hypothetical protein
MRTHCLPPRDCFRNRYRRPLIARLVRDGVLGLNGAWSRRRPTPQAGCLGLVVIVGGL